MVRVCDEPSPPLKDVEIGQSREYIESSAMLGPPMFNYAQSITSWLHPDDIINKNDPQYDPADNDIFEFATYRTDKVNYVIRYDPNTNNATAIYLSSIIYQPNACELYVSEIPGLWLGYNEDQPDLCFGKATFKDYLKKAEHSLYPLNYDSISTYCSGSMTFGGAAAGSGWVYLHCEYEKLVNSMPDLDVSIALIYRGEGSPVPWLEFEASVEDSDKSAIDDFLDKAKDIPVTSVVLYK